MIRKYLVLQTEGIFREEIKTLELIYCFCSGLFLLHSQPSASGLGGVKYTVVFTVNLHTVGGIFCHLLPKQM